MWRKTVIQLYWMQFKRRKQRFRANAAEPEAAEQRLDECVNIGVVNAAVKNASDNSDVDVCASSALQ